MRKGGRRDRGATSRDAGGFVALPWSVLDSPAYTRLSHPARALLLEISRQYVRDNNGRLLASAAYLLPRGWKSSDVITRAKRELLSGGLIHETVKGCRPNKASWYALTWHALDRIDGYDPGAVETFRRSAYMAAVLPQPKPTREQLYDRWQPKIPTLKPRGGAEQPTIAPSGGVERGKRPVIPS